MDNASLVPLFPTSLVVRHASGPVNPAVDSTADTNLYSIAGRTIRFDSPDALLEAHVRRSLVATGRRPLAELSVQVHSGRLRIAGSVPSYYVKQLAHQAAMSVEGISAIDSEIHVG